MGRLNVAIAAAFQQKTVSGTALTLNGVSNSFTFSDAEVDAANRAYITCDAQPVRYRFDGTAPDSNTGHYLATGSTIIIDGNQNLRNLKFIRATGSDGTVSITLED